MIERLVGVEEEFLLVDVSGTTLRASDALIATAVKASARTSGTVEHEFKREQVEISTPPCANLEQLTKELRGIRGQLAGTVLAEDIRIAAIGTSPLAVAPTTTPGVRYQAMEDRYEALAREQLSCGCHVHVTIENRAEAVGVIDRIRPWLAVIAALSANSPFWQGDDTGYASYRSMVWGRWPSAGPTQAFGDVETYDRAISELVKCGGLLDPGMVYFDARVSANFPTVEIRVADVCQRVEDAVLLAALCRALVQTCAREWHEGRAAPDCRVELLRLAGWRAARFGMSSNLVHVPTVAPVPSWGLVDLLLEYIATSLEEFGDTDLVNRHLDRIREFGTGADLQRDSFTRTGRLADVVLDASAVTLA